MVAFTSLRHHSADRQLETRVSRELQSVDPVGFRRVTAHARQGVVVLQGSVSGFYAKSLAFQRAQQLSGVTAVIDSLNVDRPELSLTWNSRD